MSVCRFCSFQFQPIDFGHIWNNLFYRTEESRGRGWLWSRRSSNPALKTPDDGIAMTLSGQCYRSRPPSSRTLFHAIAGAEPPSGALYKAHVCLSLLGNRSIYPAGHVAIVRFLSTILATSFSRPARRSISPHFTRESAPINHIAIITGFGLFFIDGNCRFDVAIADGKTTNSTNYDLLRCYK